MRIELCGPLGVGKTTLAQKLAARTGWTLVPEPVEAHPFLRAFYAAPARYAFEKNLFFLLDYLHQAKARAGEDVIFDHSPIVHRAYAALNVSTAAEKSVFEALDRAIESDGAPDVLINLLCPSDIALQRVRRRARDFESVVDIGYLTTLNNEMQRQVAGVAHRIPVLSIDAARYNFESSPEDVEAVLEILLARLGAQTPARNAA